MFCAFFCRFFSPGVRPVVSNEKLFIMMESNAATNRLKVGNVGAVGTVVTVALCKQQPLEFKFE